MFITFLDGQQIEAHIYPATESTLRVAVQGREDLLDLTCIRGQWVTENCEPVTIEFAWQQSKSAPVPALENCVCSPALTLQLTESLSTGLEATAEKQALKVLGAVSFVPTC